MLFRFRRYQSGTLALCLLSVTSHGYAQTQTPKTEPPAQPSEAQQAPREPAPSEGSSMPLAPELADANAPLDSRPTASPSRPPEAGKGALWGVVQDRDKSPLDGAQVTVLGTQTIASTDAEGRFRVELAPGIYALRIVADLYRPVRIRNVRIAAGRIARLDVPLVYDEQATEDSVAIEAEVERSSASTQLLLRKKDASASDGVGAKDIAKSTDRNAADALKRVVGATIVDGKYLIVRGLGDRYMSAQLNGSPLPSPEPDKQSVPLDMFPALVLSDLVVKKTFTPDMPGDFTGGLVDIHTRDIPEKLTFTGNIALGFNSETTFRDRLTYPGGDLDWLGIDDGGRKLPAEIPKGKLVSIDDNGNRVDKSVYGRALQSQMETARTFALPSGSANFVLGDSLVTKPESKLHRVVDRLGFLLSGGYSRKFQSRRGALLRNYELDATTPGALVPRNDYRAEIGSDSVQWSGLGEVSVVFNANHRIFLTGLLTQAADKESRVLEGFNRDLGAEVRDERIRFQNRGILYAQLRGEHRFKAASDATLEWKLLQARATAADPDLRETVYARNAEGNLVFRDNSQSGQHFFASQGETSQSIGADYTQPLHRDPERPIKLKLGGLAMLRGRSFAARRFRFIPTPKADSAAFSQSPNRLFSAENIGPNLELQDDTQATDAYDARYDVFAAYAMSDVALSKRLRIIVGPRIEFSKQSVDSFDPFSGTGNTESSTRKNASDVLPSLTVVYSPIDTVARPLLRELAPFIFTSYLGAREELGNPNLERTRISNFDVRAEYFPSPSEVLAISAFHKRFDRPIEPTVIQTSRGVTTFENAIGGTTTGVELEARKKLGFITPVLQEFTFLGNLTFLHSQVEIDPKKLRALTSSSRAIAGQSPFVVNMSLDWEHDKTKTRARLLYNIAGARISQVGALGLPDIYERPRNVFDLAVAQGLGEHIDLKLSIENLLDAPYRFSHGSTGDDRLTERYTIGRSIWISGTYNY
jgi:outer membrane receptor protein involved in Fe transport